MSHTKSVITSMLKVGFAALMLCAFIGGANAATTTLANMQTAFNGESNAHARYLAFAAQADREGYGEVASLFRAAARAEQIHARNHAAVIKELGAVPEANVESPQVKSTRENLQAAIQGESYERDTMYPDFLKQAKVDGNTAAERSLDFARLAEAEHAKLYTAALADLDRLKGSKSVVFYVCPTCGFTSRDAAFRNCPTCFTPKESFEKVA